MTRDLEDWFAAQRRFAADLGRVIEIIDNRMMLVWRQPFRAKHYAVRAR